MENYSGTLRIRNPKTLRKWLRNGSYQKLIDEGYIFAVGCGRFRQGVCECSRCRKATENNQLHKTIKEFGNE